MRLRKSQFPRQTCIVDRASRSCSGAPVIPGYEDDLRTCLCNTRRNGADTRLRDQLHVDVGCPVGILQVIDQLRQVLNRVDVMVRRRGDQRHPRRRVANLRDPRIDLRSRKMAALARLGSLCHLDLNLLCAHQILARHAEASGCDLFDRGVSIDAILSDMEPGGILSALAGVRLAMQMVHRDGHGLMGLLGNGPEGHRSCLEALHDLRCRLDLLNRNRLLCIVEVHQPSQRLDGVLVLNQI